jgi:hypothetical protein
MNYEVGVRRAAAGDVEDAAVCYEMQRIGLGGEFIDEVDKLLRRSQAIQPSIGCIIATLDALSFNAFHSECSIALSNKSLSWSQSSTAVETHVAGRLALRVKFDV